MSTPLRHFQGFDRTAGRPLYRQIADILRGAIERGDYGPTDQIPSETALAQHFGVARMTVRQAIEKLRGEGWVYTEPGRRGTFPQRGTEAGSPAVLGLDDVVTLATLVERITGQPLTPYQSSALKGAYQVAQNRPGGATLSAVAECLARRDD